MDGNDRELAEELLIYSRTDIDSLPVHLKIEEYWKGIETRFPKLARIVNDAIWTPVSSVDVEWLFRMYKYLLDDHRESLTEQHTKQLTMRFKIKSFGN